MVGSYGIGRNSSGDIFLALSTADHGPETMDDFTLRGLVTETYDMQGVKNECIEPFFYACAEAVEEAVLNSMVASADGTVGMNGTEFDGIPVERVKDLLKKHRVQM